MIARDPYELVIADPDWRAVLAPLLTDRARTAAGDLTPDFTRTPPALVARRLRAGAPGTGDDRRPLDWWLVVSATESPELHNPAGWRARLRPWNSQRVAVLVVGLGPDLSGWRGWVFEGGQSAPLSGFRVVGSGMPTTSAPERETDETWSRTIGAMGVRASGKASRSSVAVVGASRLGSMVAFQLAGVGIRRLVLVDPDRIEPHNVVGMTGVTAEDVGEPKALALARRLVAFRPDLAVTALPLSVLDRRAVLRDIDLIVTTVDRDSARLKAARWAVEHTAVHLDIGTGVTQQHCGRQLAADVRLLLPGRGCVRCVGGLGDLAQAEYELNAPPGAAPRRPPERWNARGRLGSLPTLNAIAAATGVQLWLDLLNGDLGGSAWHRLRWAPGGGLESAAALVGPARDCPVCRPDDSRAAQLPLG
jgi:molybdopterin/thiamine biosynthesis adenylyltransferase